MKRAAQNLLGALAYAEMALFEASNAHLISSWGLFAVCVVLLWQGLKHWERGYKAGWAVRRKHEAQALYIPDVEYPDPATGARMVADFKTFADRRIDPCAR